MKCKCFQCEERYPGCHSKCDEYKQWRKWLDEQKDMRWQEVKDPARKLIIDNYRDRHERWRKGNKHL